MIIAHHLIWTAYGWWLPNDPRGSNSHEIRVERLRPLGELHQGRKAVQPPSAQLRRFFNEAQDALKHPLLTFTPDDIQRLAASFQRVINTCQYTCYACAIMPEHVHALIRRHRDWAETMIANLQTASRTDLIAAGVRSPTHPVWGGPGWKVFMQTEADVERVVRYIEQNPLQAGLPAQKWDFVKPYDAWLSRPVREKSCP